ncbi:GNAT family N-acetyltransferase [Paenibacillus pedocola]|uniref:GNAT family N-acetyltransferase n=1 Tax=Paenibacillus pedocola TaxID=3242193 RepID=UPI0028776055|nr:GNAT family N-acetyltransferase [Paenibacillus typhae]
MKHSIRKRKANIEDLDFLVYVDLLDEGITQLEEQKLSKTELEAHYDKIKTFIDDKDRGALILENIETKQRIGTIMYCISCRDKEYPWKTIYHELDREIFQEDGRFLEIFQLWIDSGYRRHGYGTQLKRFVEDEAIRHRVNLVYTHTEESNQHVIDLNLKLGYKEVRRGPIWDEITRVSLIKYIK